MLKTLKKFFDKNKPYKIAKTLEYGFLSVGDGHKVYYETAGNKKGVPVVILHGGPGGSLSENKRKFYNPKKYYIIQIDQRGCGKSEPSLCLENNTTGHLIEDMEKLRTHLGIDKWVVAGGSWGSTLALAYSVKFKQNVLALLLNSIFLNTKEEMSAVYKPTGPASFIYPEQYELFIDPLNKTEAKDPLKAYIKKVNKAEGLEKEFLLRNFIRWECLLLGLNPNITSLDEFINSEDFDSALSAMELYYFENGCFLDSEKLVEDLQALSNIPTYMVHGRYDFLCNAKFADLAHKQIEGSKLVFTFDGHSIKSENGVKQMVSFANHILTVLEGK
jgi:proline iminopeptidase